MIWRVKSGVERSQIAEGAEFNAEAAEKARKAVFNAKTAKSAKATKMG